MYDGHINGLIAVSWSNPKKKMLLLSLRTTTLVLWEDDSWSYPKITMFHGELLSHGYLLFEKHQTPIVLND
jgi:hypothetical protein